MGRIPVSALKPGMVLDAEVRDRNGRLLLDAGKQISERHLRIFKIWSVVDVAVRDLEEAEEEEEPRVERGDDALLSAVQRYQKARFVYNDLSHPACAELYRICVERYVRLSVQQGLSPQIVEGRSLGLLTTQERLEEAGKGGEACSPEELLRLDKGLGTLPMVFHKLVDVVNDPRSSALDAAEVISYDPQLSVRLLKVVNSTFYGMRMEVDSVSRAVAIIGGNQLLSLAMGLSVVSAFSGIPADMVDMEAFWRHSVACGIAARLLAGFRKAPNTERFFVSGLLHDVGRLAFFSQSPKKAREVLENARGAGRLLVDQERLDLGLDHCRLGSVLLESWKLPLSLENNVASHHDYDSGQNRQDAALLQLADALVNALELGTSGERYVPRAPCELWEVVGVPPSAIAQVADQIDLQLEDILRFFTNG